MDHELTFNSGDHLGKQLDKGVHSKPKNDWNHLYAR